MLNQCPVVSLQVIKGTDDHSEQYMNFMNAVFTAQKKVCCNFTNQTMRYTILCYFLT